MRSQPSSRAAAMSASACSPEAWPVWTTSRWHRPRGGQHRALLVHHADPRGRGAGAAHVVVGVEGRKPDNPAVAALHAPHPLHGLGIDPAHGAVEHHAAEDLHAGHVLAREPRAIGGHGHVALEDHRLHLARGSKRGQLVVVHGAAEDVGRGMRVKIDQPLDGADGWRRRRIAAHARRRNWLARLGAGGPAVSGGRRLAPLPAVRGEPGRGEAAGVTAATDERAGREFGRICDGRRDHRPRIIHVPAEPCPLTLPFPSMGERHT